MRYREIIVEKVYGKAAIAYHRTQNIDNIDSISANGFKRGAGALYGPGVYLTYDLESQMDSEMIKRYGKYVVRCKVNLDNFLILDRPVAAMVYGKNGTSIYSQFVKQKWTHVSGKNISGKEKTRKKALDIIHALDHDIDGRYDGFGHPMTAEFARTALRFIKGFSGIVFSGRIDGSVVVAYDASTVRPFSYAEITNLSDGSENESGIQWIPLQFQKTKDKQKEKPILSFGKMKWVLGADNTYILETLTNIPLLAVKLHPNTNESGELLSGMLLGAPNPEPKNDAEDNAVVALANHLIKEGKITHNSTMWSKWYEQCGYVWREGQFLNIAALKNKMDKEFISNLKPLHSSDGESSQEGLTLDWGYDNNDVVEKYAFDNAGEQLEWMNIWADAVKGTVYQSTHLRTFLNNLTMSANVDEIHDGRFKYPDGSIYDFSVKDGRYIITKAWTGS